MASASVANRCSRLPVASAVPKPVAYQPKNAAVYVRTGMRKTIGPRFRRQASVLMLWPRGALPAPARYSKALVGYLRETDQVDVGRARFTADGQRVHIGETRAERPCGGVAVFRILPVHRPAVDPLHARPLHLARDLHDAIPP